MSADGRARFKQISRRQVLGSIATGIDNIVTELISIKAPNAADYDKSDGRQADEDIGYDS